MAQGNTSADADRPLISNATILILSGFLIGLTVGKIVAEDLSPYVLACGLSGFLAFIALELTAEQRFEQAIQAEQDSITRRLDRHVTPVATSPLYPLTGDCHSDQNHVDSFILAATRGESKKSGIC